MFPAFQTIDAAISRRNVSKKDDAAEVSMEAPLPKPYQNGKVIIWRSVNSALWHQLLSRDICLRLFVNIEHAPTENSAVSEGDHWLQSSQNVGMKPATAANGLS